jgi:hypothetical protein
MITSFAFLHSNSLSSSSTLELSTIVLIQPTLHSNGIQPLHPRFRSDRDLMRVRRLLGWQTMKYDRRIRYGAIPLTNLQCGEIILFCLICVGRARAPGVFLLRHIVGELRSLASPPDAACHRLGGDLHQPLQDVRGCAVIGVPIPALLHVVSLWEESNPPGGLILTGQEQAVDPVRHPPQPRQMGPLEGGLGDCTDRLP